MDGEAVQADLKTEENGKVYNIYVRWTEKKKEINIGERKIFDQLLTDCKLSEGWA